MQSGLFDGSRRNYFFPRMTSLVPYGAASRRLGGENNLDGTMYLRFVVADIDEDSERNLGVFHAVGNLLQEGRLYAYEEELHDSVRQWFNENLERPTRFTAAKRPFYRKKNRALSWFKDSAHHHIAQVREFVVILQNHGVPVRMLKADRVGYVVYEDDYQVVAEPFADVQC